MAYQQIEYPKDKKAFYPLLCAQLRLYTDGAPTPEAALANAAAVLKAAFPGVNWAGFYLSDGQRLVLGPFQGQPAVMEIAFGQGVCGAAFREKKAQVVADVHRFAGHIACDCDSLSELVVPVFDRDGEVLGVIDMDSPEPGYFTLEDAEGMRAAAEVLAPHAEAARRAVKRAGGA